MKNFREIMKFAGAYISVCIGSGFATGQEIMQFFSAYGMVSLVSNLVCMIILSYCGASLLQMGKTVKLKNNNDIFTYLCGKRLGTILKYFMPVFFFCSFVVMISGAGASINQYYGLDKTFGSLILIILSLISVLLGMNKVLEILGNIGPAIAFTAIGIGIVTIARNYETFYCVNEVVSTLSITKALDKWWMSGFIYSGLNLIIATPFLVGAGATAKNKKNCLWGGVLGGVIFMLAAITLNLGLLSDIQNVYIREIPTLYMADKIGPVVGGMFSLMLIAGIYTTAVPLLWTVCSSFAKDGSKRFAAIAVACSIVGFIGGRLPFATLVNFIYPISGALGSIIIFAIFIKKIKLTKKLS